MFSLYADIDITFLSHCWEKSHSKIIFSNIVIPVEYEILLHDFSDMQTVADKMF